MTKASTYFGRRANYYDRQYDGFDADGHALRARMAVTLELLGDGPGSVLDVGMGPGRLCEELDARGWTVSGADASWTMVSVAKERLPALRDRLVQAEIEALPFADGAFDAVAATGVLEYAQLPGALTELARVVRPGGRVVVSYPNPHALYGIWKSRVWYRAVRTGKRLLRRSDAWLPRGGSRRAPAQFAALLEASGLTVLRIEHSSYLLLPTPLDLAAPRAAARLGARLERRGPRFAARLATQVVFEARKPA